MRVHTLSKGALGIPMPNRAYGDQGRKVQGGLPPEPYRARNDWGNALRSARSDGTSRACRAECYYGSDDRCASVKFNGLFRA